LSERGERV